LPPQPAPSTELLLKPLPRRTRLAPDGHIDPREPPPLRTELEDNLAKRAPEPPAARRLDHTPRPVRLHDLGLNPPLVKGRIQPIPGRRPDAKGPGTLKPKVALVMIRPAGPSGNIS